MGVICSANTNKKNQKVSNENKEGENNTENQNTINANKKKEGVKDSNENTNEEKEKDKDKDQDKDNKSNKNKSLFEEEKKQQENNNENQSKKDDDNDNNHKKKKSEKNIKSHNRDKKSSVNKDHSNNLKTTGTEEMTKNTTGLSSNAVENSNHNQLVTLDNNVIIARGAMNPDEIYIKEKLLGKGSYGVVYLVKHKELHRYFAMKIIKKRHKSKQEEEALMNEINILKRLDHPNILKINDFYSFKNEYNIITEYCQEGELFNEIKTYAPFQEPVAGYYMKQILTAVCYCHGMNVIHRDLKPENILIVKRSKNGCHPIKIIDFGTAKIFNKGERENLLIGSSYYIAPEVLNRNYTEKCDIWSCGIIMYILLTGRPPFCGNDDEEIIGRVRKGKFDLTKYPWGIISNEAKDLIRHLLDLNPNKRLSAEQALKHPWFELKKMKAIDKIINNLDVQNARKLVENLKRYKSDNILRCAVIGYLVHNNTQLAQAHDAIKLFNKIDANGDGRIVKEELYNGLRSYLKLTGNELINEVDTIFNNIDTDHNGYIEYEEFIRAAVDKEYFLNNNFLKFAFNYFDQDRSGNITMDEVLKLFNQNDSNKKDSVRQQLKNSFNQIDVNGDGSLTFDEFCQMMKNIIINDE